MENTTCQGEPLSGVVLGTGAGIATMVASALITTFVGVSVYEKYGKSHKTFMGKYGWASAASILTGVVTSMVGSAITGAAYLADGSEPDNSVTYP